MIQFLYWSGLGTGSRKAFKVKGLGGGLCSPSAFLVYNASVESGLKLWFGIFEYLSNKLWFKACKKNIGTSVK